MGGEIADFLQHTEDDAQPYQIFTQEDLRRSCQWNGSWTSVRDPARGNEVVGTPLFPGFNLLLGAGNFLGGNPDVLPERSETLSAGVIFTPRWVSDLRISVDWTRIESTTNTSTRRDF